MPENVYFFPKLGTFSQNEHFFYKFSQDFLQCTDSSKYYPGSISKYGKKW